MKRGICKKGLLLAACAVQLFLLCACESGRNGAQGEATLGENILIDGVNVSNLSVSEARAALSSAHAQARASFSFTVAIGGEQLKINGAQLPISFNEEEALAFAVSLKKHYPAKNAPRAFTCAPSVDAEALRSTLRALLAPYNIAPENASFSFDASVKERFAYAGEREGREIDVAPLAAQIKAAVEGSGARPAEASVLGAAAPHEARFEARIVTLSPSYTLEDAKADTAPVSRFQTSFKGSVYGKKNRVFNIKKAVGLINGTVVPPGGEFDMNRTIGDRNAQNGWKEAAAIRDATYVQEYGGGVCQVSTTLYNAVLMADLEVTERWHHSWPLGYVDIGRDATISTGGPNFKFKNNTAASIVICAYVEEDKKLIHVELYGRALENGVSIKLKSYKVDTLEAPGEDLVLDATLPFNTREVVREKRVGSVAETYKEYYDASGRLLKKVLVARDKYRSVKGLTMVSRDIYYGYTPPPTP
ncbi:MAG: VanW family protein [Clostridiaceae bacterium]